MAGQQAAQRSANEEAISHLTTALELLKTLPDTPERAQQELTLQIALGVSLDGYQGLGGPRSGARPTPGRENCVGKWRRAPQLFPVLCGLWAFYQVRGELQPARAPLAEQSSTLAQSTQDLALLLEAHYATRADPA